MPDTKNFFLLLIAALLACQVAAASGLPAEDAGKPVIYDQSKSAIMVSKKQPLFLIKLAANPSTGYTWLLRDYDKSILIPVKHQYQAPSTHLVGAPGFDLWTFNVKPSAFSVPHRTTLKLIYARPWENDKNADEAVFVVTTHAG